MKTKQLLLFFLSPLALFAFKGGPDIVTGKTEPWFTGPLLCPSGHVIPLGHQNIEPYVYYNRNVANYNSHWKSVKAHTFTNVFTQITIQIGILPRLELNLNPQFSYNHNQGQHSWRVNDSPIGIDIQLYQDVPEVWYPAVKFKMGVNLPIGKYDNLDPNRKGTDFGGIGNWSPSLGIVFSRVVNVFDNHYLSWRFFLSYHFATPVHVHGLSVYGGAPAIGPIPATHGTVYPSKGFTVIQGLEFTLTQNWVLALDIEYDHTTRRRFSGFTVPGTSLTHPSRESFSIAPAIEYNFNANVGWIFGPWFSVAGRNTFDFSNWVFAINVYH